MGKKWCFVMILIGLMLLGIGAKTFIEPNLDEISRLKAQGLVRSIIGETIKETFVKELNPEELFLIKKDENGKMQLIQANTVVMNEKITALTVALQKKYQKMVPEKISIPFGTIFGSPLLSQAEKGVEIRVLPLSVSRCDFQTEFESQGINQTKYKIFLEIETEVRVLQPFSRENFSITTRLLFAEIVIVGEVPQNYVYVPEQDILDVT